MNIANSICDPRHLIVSLHDAHPGSFAAIREQVEELAVWGVPVTSILVIPHYHHEVPADEDAAFTQTLTDWELEGHELVLHGYYHDRRGLTDNVKDLFWTRLYTSREAEFLDLDPEAAAARLNEGASLFRKYGWNMRGFIAPAWLMAPHLPALLGKLGFSYTNTVAGIIATSQSGERVGLEPTTFIPARSLCYSTRAQWRRTTSLYWNAWLHRQLLRSSNIIRISLHPNDFQYPRIRRQIENAVKKTLDAGYEPTTYADYVSQLWKAF
ncbi:MAG: DUF2334 domain-containing protein [Candidatus Methylacidiphilales bacterium]|nr:polysaccharide deacetylase family protein [Candidatus Methylacidiphilales bacterium]